MSRFVSRTEELIRILSLPRRQWEDVATPEACALLTRHLRTPRGTMTLLPVQCAALVELHDWGGVFLQAGVGQGKTLISALAAAVVKAKRPLLIVPANLREKTKRDLRALAEHWQVPPITVASYEEVGRGGLLETLQPDLVILDEGHKAKNPGAKITRKLRRYVKARRELEQVQGRPLLWVLVMSGTLCKRSIIDFAHLARWSQPNRCPLPIPPGELKSWALAVDEKVADRSRVDAGALLMLGGEGTDELTQARTGLQARIFSTPGFIATTRNDVPDCSLVVECHQVELSDEVQDAYEELRHYRTPCGLDIENGIERWRHARELATDFYYRFKVPPPIPWMNARRDYYRSARHVIQYGMLAGVDSEADARKWIRKKGKGPEFEALTRWEAIEPTFELETLPVWCSDHCLRFVQAWAAKHTGVIWTEWPIVGMRLAKALGIEYYGREGLNRHGQPIEAEDGSRSAVASIKANGTGRNLQTIWSRALVTSAPPTGTDVEQMLGRLHRRGQLADEVVFDFMIACEAQWSGFVQSMRDADYHNQVLGSDMKMRDGQKAVDIVIPLFDASGPAWKKPVSNSARAA